MRSILASPGTSPVLVLLLALGCGDTPPDSGDDEAAGTSTGDESADSVSNPESGGEANDTLTATGSGGSSSSETNGSSSDTADTSDSFESGNEDPLDTSSETAEPIDCTQLDEPTCMGTEVCAPYMGMPYTMGGDGMICLGPSQFLGCLVAIDACLPATGTLCMGDQAYAVDNLCPPPEGYMACDPPVVFAEPCMP